MSVAMTVVPSVPPEDKLSQNLYKSVKIWTPLPAPKEEGTEVEKQAKLSKNYPYKSLKPCISFNTVPVPTANAKHIDKRYYQDFPGVQFPTDYTMEEFYDNESGFDGNNNPEYMLHNQYLLNNLAPSSTHLNGSDSGRHQSPTRLSSPPPASGKRVQSHKSIQLTQMFKIAKNGRIVREDYPTRPSIQNNSLVLNSSSPDWDKLWTLRRLQIDNRTLHKDKFFKYPDIVIPEHKPNATVLEDMDSDGFTPLTKNQKRKIKVISERVGYPTLPRTVMCRIDGRKHTWVGLDWLLSNGLHDTDHLVVVSNLPSMTARQRERHSRSRSAARSGNGWRSPSRSRSRGRSRTGRSRSGVRDSASEATYFTESDTDSDDDDDVDTEVWYSGYDLNNVHQTMQNIKTYIESVMLLNTPQRAIKLTIEINVGKTISCLCGSTNIYTPDLVVTSNLNTESAVKWRSGYIADKLCTSFPIPVVVVPALYMNRFEYKLEMESEALRDKIPDESGSLSDVPPKSKRPDPKELLDGIDKISYDSLRESIRLNKVTSHAKKKSMIEAAGAEPTGSSLKVPKKKSSKKGSVSSDTRLRKVQTTDASRLKPVKTNSYSIAEHNIGGPALHKTRSSEGRVPLKHYKSSVEVPRKHVSASSSSSSSSKGFFGSLFGGSKDKDKDKKKKKRSGLW